MVKPTGRAFAKNMFAKVPIWTKIIFDGGWNAVIGVAVVFLQWFYTSENESNQNLSCRKPPDFWFC